MILNVEKDHAVYSKWSFAVESMQHIRIRQD